MNVLVTDTGFGQVVDSPVLDLAPDTDPLTLVSLLGLPLIAIRFASFTDGRGFTLARQLRDLGYGGRLRATGDLLPDQYAMARRSGFDEVEITEDRAARSPEADWRARADWRTHHHQARLRG